MAEQTAPKILRFPNRQERRANLAKAGVKKEAKINGLDLDGVSQDEAPVTYDETVKELPRYLRRAFESRDEDRVVACLEKAQEEGWTIADLTKAMHKFTREESLGVN